MEGFKRDFDKRRQTEQKQIQKKIFSALSSQTSEGISSFVILLVLMSLEKTKFLTHHMHACMKWKLLRVDRTKAKEYQNS